MSALIIGANGQDGFYLNQLLLEKGIPVTGISRSGNFINIDISDFDSIKKIIAKLKPQYIFHLAANSTVAHHALFDNYAAISAGTINILESVKQVSPNTKIFLSGSGLQFKNKNLPIKETDEFEASSAYSVARIHSVYAARYYRSLGLHVYVGYFFNHESPRRTERHISKMIAEAVKRIQKGSKEKIEIGDMKVNKEWTFAGDVMKAVMTLVEQDYIYEAVIGSGIGYSIQEYIEKCFAFISIDWNEFVKEKENFTAQYKQLICEPSTIFLLDWKPEKKFDDLINLMLTS